MYAGIVEAHESARKRVGVYSSEISRRPHRRERGFNSLIHSNLVHKFIPMRQAMKITDAKAAVKKGMREAREDPCVADG